MTAVKIHHALSLMLVLIKPVVALLDQSLDLTYPLINSRFLVLTSTITDILKMMNNSAALQLPTTSMLMKTLQFT